MIPINLQSFYSIQPNLTFNIVSDFSPLIPPFSHVSENLEVNSWIATQVGVFGEDNGKNKMSHFE